MFPLKLHADDGTKCCELLWQPFISHLVFQKISSRNKILHLY